MIRWAGALIWAVSAAGMLALVWLLGLGPLNQMYADDIASEAAQQLADRVARASDPPRAADNATAIARSLVDPDCGLVSITVEIRSGAVEASVRCRHELLGDVATATGIATQRLSADRGGQHASEEP